MIDQPNFTSAFIALLQPGWTVLDIGAGEGKFTQMFLERGMKVVAVDPKTSLQSTDTLTVKQMTIEEFCASDDVTHYDAIFSRNAVQFMPKSWVTSTLVPWMTSHLSTSGVLALKTFFQPPEPPFARPIPSLYTLAELQAYFPEWESVMAEQYEHDGLDMNGVSRKFFSTDLIVRKK